VLRVDGKGGGNVGMGECDDIYKTSKERNVDLEDEY
jgi:hypothetical protein